MNPTVKAAWIAALRSGEYKQGYGKLRTNYSTEKEYCCLGVLCDLYIKTSDEAYWWDGSYFKSKNEIDSYTLPDCVLKWAELDSTNPRTSILNPDYDPNKKSGDCNLPFFVMSELNDTLQWNFLQIAKQIEKDF